MRRFHLLKAIDAGVLTGYFLAVFRRELPLEVSMRRRCATGILAVFALAVLSASADDFWVKKDWKQWSAADCKKLLESSPWTVRKMVENESNVNRLPSAANGANADTAQNRDAGE